jgi:hypothetical protein
LTTAKTTSKRFQKPAGSRIPARTAVMSPWQQVLLTIDRALVCKNCWYRIILDISEDEDVSQSSEEKE